MPRDFTRIPVAVLLVLLFTAGCDAGGNVSEPGQPADPYAELLARLSGDAARYRWLRDFDTHGWASGATFSFVRGIPQDEVIRRFADGRASALPTVSMDEAIDISVRYAFLEDKSAAVLDTIGEWTIIAEANGWLGATPDVIERASKGGELISVYWNVNGVTWIHYASNGTLVTAFEAIFPDDREGSDPDHLDALTDGLPFGVHPLMAIAGMSLAGRLTGVWLDPEWAATPRRAVLMPWP